MICNWKSFQIDLPSFLRWLNQNIPSADGICAESSNFNIIETTPFTSEEIDMINNYINLLTEEGEDIKRARPSILQTKFEAIRTAAIPKRWVDMSILERKIIAQVPLSESEMEEIYNYEI